MTPILIELPTPFPVGPVNTFLFIEPELILIDAGVKTDESWAALERGMAEQGLKIADLQKIIITHPHVDHMGMAWKIAEHSGAMVHCSEIAREWVGNTRKMWRLRADYYEHHFLPYSGLNAGIFAGMIGSMKRAGETADFIPPDRLVTFPTDGTLEMGGLTWEVLYMPGHTDYQTCFYQRETRQFISADMLLHKAPTPIVERPLSPNTPRTPGLPKFLKSLDTVEQLDIDTVYPGHGPIMSQPHTLIQNQRRRIEMRKNECAELVQAGYTTLDELLAQMYHHVPPQHRFPGLWMLVGYLDLLKAEGKAQEETVAGIWHYSMIGD